MEPVDLPKPKQDLLHVLFALLMLTLLFDSLFVAIAALVI